VANDFKVVLTGVKELQAKLKAMDLECQAALKEGVSNAEKIVEQDAKRRVRVRTGKLRDSIEEKNRVETSTKVEAQIGTDVSYGSANEFGTRYMTAQPFMRPAVDENKPVIKAAILTPIEAVIRRYK